jgi:arabinogalactan oligomer / maltooligosaccharide transport system permease protein
MTTTERSAVTKDPATTRPGPPPDDPPTGPRRTAFDRLGAGGSPTALVVKLLLLAFVNGLAIYAIPRIIDDKQWPYLVAVIGATIAIDVVYLSKRRIPAKYLIPGTLFLLAFQVYPVLYTGYIAFTNYGTGNLLTKSQAVDQIEGQSLFTPDGAVRYAAVPLEAPDGSIAVLLTDPDGAQFLGTNDALEPVDAGDVRSTADGRVEAVGDLTAVPFAEAGARTDELQDLRVPVDDGEIRLTTLTEASVQEQLYVFDSGAGTMVNQVTGEVFSEQEGTFTSDTGATLNPGWRVTVGVDNFTRVLTSDAVRGPFVRVFIWTFVFAALSVLSTFVVGLLLAMVLQNERLLGRKVFRVLFIVPYALPSFMTALIWQGLLNDEFGAVNRIFGTSIPWLTDPYWAKFSILLVNLWLGFPYMFLICTGALQSIPGEIQKAAQVDGASGIAAFRKVTFPLLMVSVAPLLIGSFAFNFNNFNIVYLLTRGGPPIEGAATPAGHTDILISYTYRLAFEGGQGTDFGFASAVSVLIFVLVASISAFSFRYTKALEETR